LSKTHIWKDLVNSEKQLIEEEQPKLINRKNSKKNQLKMSLKLGKNTSTTTTTTPTQKPSHTGILSSNIPAIDEDVPLMSSPNTNLYASPVPQIIVINSRTPAQSPIQENQTKL